MTSGIIILTIFGESAMQRGKNARAYYSRANVPELYAGAKKKTELSFGNNIVYNCA